MCSTDLEKELTAQQHLLPDTAQMRAHIVTVINSRPRGPGPMMMGYLNEEASNHDAGSDEFVESEDRELYRLEIRNGKKVFTKPRYDSNKGNTEGGWRAKPTMNVFVVDALATSEQMTEPRHNGNDCRDGDESSFFGIGGMSRLTFCRMRTLGHKMNRGLYPARKVASL